MAYFDGDMDAEQMPIVDRMDTEYTIYVNSLPPELNKDGIRDIFGQYGEIMAMYVSSNRTWAYITYKTYREAELAIREFNDRKPLCLKVALSKRKITQFFVREEQESYPNIEEAISKVYEKRAKGLYEYSEDKFKNQVHSCSVCSTNTLKHCEKCHTYYCSKACQLEDWPPHQAECERIT